MQVWTPVVLHTHVCVCVCALVTFVLGREKEEGVKVSGGSHGGVCPVSSRRGGDVSALPYWRIPPRDAVFPAFSGLLDACHCHWGEIGLFPLREWRLPFGTLSLGSVVSVPVSVSSDSEVVVLGAVVFFWALVTSLCSALLAFTRNQHPVFLKGGGVLVLFSGVLVW